MPDGEIDKMYPEILDIKSTKRSPRIILDRERIFIMGRSIIENPSIFYEPVISWMSEFTRHWTGKTRIDLGFEYINTGSIKWLYILLREMSEKKNFKDKITVNWHYESGDEDMCELGFIFRSLLDCSFTLVEIKSMNDRFYDDFLSMNS